MLSRTLEWSRGLWRFYLAYTQTATHAAAAAAFAIFGLLVFVDSLFAIVAISAYVVPPIVLYVLEDEPPRSQDRRAGRTPERQGKQRQPQERPGQDRSVEGRERTEEQPIEASSGEAPPEMSERGSRAGWTEDASSTLRDGNGDTDSDSDDGDTDSDSDDGDTDSDSDDGDTDSDSDDGDTDSDSDDGDTDSDSDDGDTDSDS